MGETDLDFIAKQVNRISNAYIDKQGYAVHIHEWETKLTLQAWGMLLSSIEEKGFTEKETQCQ